MKFIEDVLFVLGAAAIVGATFVLSVVAGLYATGITFILFGVGYAFYAGKRGDK